MYRNMHEGKINFTAILEDCKKRFTPFQKETQLTRVPLQLGEAIRKAAKGGRNPVIAELKYRSPKGVLRKTGSPESLAIEMLKGGACAISVLTEESFFGGSLENLRRLRRIAPVPLLRKDFLFHPTQIPESYHYGADTVLLISTLLSRETLEEMIEKAREYGMEPAVEVHSEEDIAKAEDAGAEIYVVNNRDWETLELELERTARLCPKINGVKISASGMETGEQVRNALKHADAALIGTAIMKAKDIALKVSELVEA